MTAPTVDNDVSAAGSPASAAPGGATRTHDSRMTATGAGQTTEIAEFVRAVRVELADLPASTVDDLVGGLRADLAALVDDSGLPLHRVVSTPTRYAADLRAGADLPQDQAPVVRRRMRTTLLTRWRNSRLADVVTRDTAVRPEFLAFCRAVIPAWWVVRGVVLAAVANLVVNTDGIALALLHLGFVVLSVEIGRRHRFARSAEARRRLDRGTDAAGGLLLFLMLPLFFDFLSWGFSGGRATAYQQTGPGSYGDAMGDGVVNAGNPVGNLFVFDRFGDLVPQARIVDDRGDLLELSAVDYVDARSGDVVTAVDYAGPTGSSRAVFPLDVSPDVYWDEMGEPAGDSRLAASPVPALPPLLQDPAAGGSARTDSRTDFRTDSRTDSRTDPRNGPN